MCSIVSNCNQLRPGLETFALRDESPHGMLHSLPGKWPSLMNFGKLWLIKSFQELLTQDYVLSKTSENPWEYFVGMLGNHGRLQWKGNTLIWIRLHEKIQGQFKSVQMQTACIGKRHVSKGAHRRKLWQIPAAVANKIQLFALASQIKSF